MQLSEYGQAMSCLLKQAMRGLWVNEFQTRRRDLKRLAEIQ